MNYRILKRNIFTRGKYSLVPLRKEDIFSIKEWRNSQIKYLRQQRQLKNKEQELYFKKVVTPGFESDKPDLVLFSYLLHGECIGYGGLTNISWRHKRTEISFLLATDRAKQIRLYKKEFSIFLDIIKEIAFKALHLHRIFTETYDIRSWHVDTLKKNSFILEGRLREHAIVEGRRVDSLLHGILRRDVR